jgi:OOP family OmpA-OmpF porin
MTLFPSIRHFFGCAFAAPLIMFATSASAQYYGGLNLGQSKAGLNGGGISSQFLDLGFATPQVSLSDQKTSYGLRLGYQFTPHFAVEGNYADLGKSSYNANVTPSGTLSTEPRARGYGFDLVGTLPIFDKFSLLGRVGVRRTKTDGGFAGTGSVDTFNTSASQTTNAGRFGLGVQYDLSKNIGLRLEMERFRKLGSNALGSVFDADNYSVGVLFQF